MVTPTRRSTELSFGQTPNWADEPSGEIVRGRFYDFSKLTDVTL
jgi:hypothetical protein